LVWFILTMLVGSLPAAAQSLQPPEALRSVSAQSGVQAGTAASAEQSPVQRAPGSISGTVGLSTGALLGEVRVTLTRDDHGPGQEVLSSDDGQFSFAGVAPGSFHLTFTAEGFNTQVISGTLQPGESLVVPPVVMAVATAVTRVSVVMPRVEVAEAELKEEEKQRALGFLPNFYVSYIPDAAPLTPKQKFELAWKTTIDPVTWGIVGAFAGIEQATNVYSGYGQGAQGFGKRFGAGFADSTIGTFIGGAVLPSLLKQDPRYFYKGTGSKRYRLLYAIANAVICKSDKGHWQPNYSGILGSVAAGGISNLYYPDKYQGAALVFEASAIGIGASAVANIFQEFVVRRFTPHLPKPPPANP
jgi:hypothetical protein